MGFLGSIIGWDQQKDAHNAILGNYIAEIASAELKSLLAQRLVIIEQQVRGNRPSSQILQELSECSRIVQGNYIALACNSLGIPGPNGIAFAAVENPHRSHSPATIARLGVALDDLSKRLGRQLHWPGSHVPIDFRPWLAAAPADESVLELSEPVAGTPAKPASVVKAKSVDVPLAVNLVHHMLFQGIVDRTVIAKTAVAFAAEGIGNGCEYQLALFTALSILETEEMAPVGFSLQLMARAVSAEWMVSGKVNPLAAALFEDRLSDRYKP